MTGWKGFPSRKKKILALFAVLIAAIMIVPVFMVVLNNTPSVNDLKATSSLIAYDAVGNPIPHYFGPYPNYATSQLPTVTANATTGGVDVTGGIRKFIDSLPGLGEAGVNNLGQYIPVAVADTKTYPGSEYYEIAVVEYREKMHTDLSPTTLRGYIQLETVENIAVSKHVALTFLNGTPVLKADGSQAIAVDNPHYLGPFIVANRDVPVRVKFSNLLPTGVDGDLFIPVDTTVMGAGSGPIPGESYTENRANIHLHGGNTPWISDGTPHQWITPAGEDTPYPEGVSVQNVPDMPDPGPGSQTFYYTNQQSARLLFYHDHSYGITRLNVYIGEASGYILMDEVEKQLIASGVIPSVQIPLVIQDKTFVPDNTVPISNMWGNFSSQLAFQDPTWNTTKWGNTGDLWYPHVYMTMENPGDPTGMNTFGRWFYSPWFYPPHMPINGPIENPYYNASDPLEPLIYPGVPSISSPGESFMDTPVVNGAAYPYLEIDPQTYRFRVLNAANDRFFNLQLYVADSSVITPDGRTNTEVKMVPAAFTAGYPETWPTDGRAGGVPDPATAGPEMIQIGTEGGFLPTPVVLPNTPLNWNANPGTFDVGLVNQGTLMIGPAERADVIIDFSQYAGKTIILYNDAPAPWPALDPRQDYYTGHPDLTSEGGSNTTIAGYGSNTRTIMQIRVSNNTPDAPFNLTALFEAFTTNSTHTGVFAASQHEIIFPQAEYNSAYNMTLPENNWLSIFAKNATFTPINGTAPVTIKFENKAIHDEMGAAYDKEYGRMMVLFGVEQPNPTPLTSNVILYGYVEPPTEVIATSIPGTQIGSLKDGTQIWKISHNGVDSHTIHWHMYDVQLISRVAWDGIVRPPLANELGWKETIRIDPLQDTFIALRPIIPDLPFDLPNSIRPLNPALPLGAPMGMDTRDPLGNQVTLVNHMVNFGWEYVWHCHMLSHEENDIMRAVAIGVYPRDPTNLTASLQVNKMVLSWTDNSLSETNFTIERADDPLFTTNVVRFSVAPNIVMFNDTSILHGYYYRVCADNLVGDSYNYGAPPIVGFPTILMRSNYTNVVGPAESKIEIYSITQGIAPGSPIIMKWLFTPSGGQTGFVIQRATNPLFTENVAEVLVGGNVLTYSDSSVVPGTQYYYRVMAINGMGVGVWSNIVVITPH